MLSGYVGLFLMGAAFMALGVFVSSLTENQIISAAVTFGVALLFWVLSWSAQLRVNPGERCCGSSPYWSISIPFIRD